MALASSNFFGTQIRPSFLNDSDIKVREADDRPQEAAKSTGNAARDMVAAAEAAGQHIYNQPRAEVVYDEDAVISAGKKRSSRPGLRMVSSA